MVYSDKEDFAKSKDVGSWKEYEQRGLYPKKLTTLKADAKRANSRINFWIGCKNVDITDPQYTQYLLDLEVEVIKRIHDKEKHRQAGQQQGIYNPHDYLYVAERQFLKAIGQATGYRRKRGII